VHRDGAEHREAHADLDLDERVPALQPAQHEAPTGSRGGVGGPATGRLGATHRLSGRSERGQVRGGLGAVACTDGGGEVEHRHEHADQHRDGGRGPHRRDTVVAVVAGAVGSGGGHGGLARRRTPVRPADLTAG